MTTPHQTVHVTQIDGLGEGATANFGTEHDEIARGDHAHAVATRYRQMVYVVNADGSIAFVSAAGEAVYILKELE
jgi:hypothetical protein